MRLTRAWLIPLGLAVAAVAASACGGDGDDGTGSGGSGELGGPAPNLSAPASKYAPYLNELAGAFEVNPGETYGFTAQLYAGSGPFANQLEASELIEEWGYADGYQAAFEPQGQLASVLSGRFFVNTEVHLFTTVDGARKAFAKYETQYAGAPGSVPVSTAAGLANQSAAFEYPKGTVGTSTTAAVSHSFMFRRGNMVALVRTFGGQPFMTIEQARSVAVIIDEHALGKRVNVEPTPDTRGGAPTPVGRK